MKNKVNLFIIFTILLIILTFFVRYYNYNNLIESFNNNKKIVCKSNIINKNDGFIIKDYGFYNESKNKFYNISKCYKLKG